MFAVAVVTDHLANTLLMHGTGAPSSRVHLIDDVTKAIDRAQHSRQAYLATGEDSYLEAYRTACTEVDSSMDRLVTEDYVVTSNLVHAEDLREFVHQKLSEIGKGLEVNPPARGAGSMPVADTDLARVRKVLDSLAQNESRDINGELDSARARTVFHRNLVVALGVINVLFLAGVAFCAMKIGSLYSLITMCAWSKRVQFGGQWIPLEEYMKKRFGLRISHGISEEEFEKWAVGKSGDAAHPQDGLGIETLPVETPAPKAAA
jgi:CHASE3 domain sensor protein